MWVTNAFVFLDIVLEGQQIIRSVLGTVESLSQCTTTIPTLDSLKKQTSDSDPLNPCSTCHHSAQECCMAGNVYPCGITEQSFFSLKIMRCKKKRGTRKSLGERFIFPLRMRVWLLFGELFSVNVHLLCHIY